MQDPETCNKYPYYVSTQLFADEYLFKEKDMKRYLLTLPLLFSTSAFAEPFYISNVQSMGDCAGADISVWDSGIPGEVEIVAEYSDLAANAAPFDRTESYKRCNFMYNIELPRNVILDRMEFNAAFGYTLEPDARVNFRVSNRPMGSAGVTESLSFEGPVDDFYDGPLGSIYREQLPARFQNAGAVIPMSTRASVEIIPGDFGGRSDARFLSLTSKPGLVTLQPPPKVKNKTSICKIFFRFI